MNLIDQAMVGQIITPRKPFSHKGDYGHAAIVAGSYGMMGAAVLCARACLRSGVGKLTCHIPASGYTIMQISVPEAMCKTGEETHPAQEMRQIRQYWHWSRAGLTYRKQQIVEFGF